MAQQDTSHDLRLSLQESVTGFCIFGILAMVCLVAAYNLIPSVNWKQAVGGFYLLVFGLLFGVIAASCIRDAWLTLRESEKAAPKPAGLARH